MKNDYEVRGDVTAIFIDSPKYGRHESLISTSKLERAKEFPNSWYIRKGHGCFYVIGNMPGKRTKRVSAYLHRWITNAPIGMVVDHISHDTLNNIDSNLRVVTHAENLQNRIGATSISGSGVRGVSWHKRNNNWQGKIRINGVDKYIGSFKRLEDAEQAVIEARFKYMPFSTEASL